MKATDYISKYLESRNVKIVFELSGGMITHLLDSISQTTSIQIISMHHEQAAAFAAEGYARMNGTPGVALATSGPGATNLLTGIASCYFDSIPCIFITGQVNTHEIKKVDNIRQLGFQETDIVSMSKPITKGSFQVIDKNDISKIFNLAFELSVSGRPGPVLIDIPFDIQRSELEEDFSIKSEQVLTKNKLTELENLIREIDLAKKPLILAGRGIRAGNAISNFHEFLNKVNIPVVFSLLGLDLLDYNNPNRVGFIGSYGNRWANKILGECDLLIVLGARLDIRQTGADTHFFGNRKIFHIDCESGEINNRILGCIPIVADLNYFFQEFIKKSHQIFFKQNYSWVNYVNHLKQLWPDINEVTNSGINPNKFMHLLSEVSKKAASYIVDVGSHQMWAAQSLELDKNQLFLTSGGMGAMGFALPASIGACFAVNKAPVIAIIGDGCMQINIQELQTIHRNSLPIKIIVINNNTLGMIRQFQDSYFNSRYQSTSWGYSAPNFEAISNAYGIEAKTITNYTEIIEAIKWLWLPENELKPQLLQVIIDPKTNTYPKLAFGKPITEMEPFAKPLDMEGT